MRDFLLEIGTEEIPARCLDQLALSLENDIKNAFVKAGIKFREDNNAGQLSTYRRLAIRFLDVAEFQDDREEIISGPPLSLSKSDSGEWLPAAIGFAKKAGIQIQDLDQCVGIDSKGREMLSFRKFIKGDSTINVLSRLVPQVLSDLSLPVAMRWGSNDKTFYRPVQWIVCLLGEQVVPFTFFEVISGKVSRGHRFLTENSEGSILGAPCLISEPSKYESVLQSNYVISNKGSRLQKILDSGLVLETDEVDCRALLNEVVNLVEFPVVLEGSFDSEYLHIPSEVLSKTMMSHQRYFPIYVDKKITNRFAVVAENVRESNQNTIIVGNERVLIARLEDAKFFFNEDKKRSLESYISELDNITFQKGMGTLFDKKERVKKLAFYIADLVGYLDKEILARTCDLCKADLVTKMVYEFPELQGVMGEYYANLSGETTQISQAIREHYYPLSSTSCISTSVLGNIVALADRVDTIVVTYQNGLIPTGSKDPLGIRRAMLGLLKIEKQNDFSLDFVALFKKGYEILGKGEGNIDALLSFFVQRLQTFLEDEANVPYDVAQSVTEIGLVNLNQAIDFAIQLSDGKNNDPSFKSLLETAVRVKRLSKQSESMDVDTRLFVESAEKTAFDVLSRLTNVSKLGDLHCLILPMNQYFNEVMVMVEDSDIRRNRLAFLSRINAVFLSIADFEKIVVGS